MSVTHPTTIRNGIADHVCEQVDTGGAGTIVFRTSGNSEIATLTFSAQAFLAASNGIAAANSITDDTNCNAGDVDKFEVVSGGGDIIFQGSVRATGANPAGDIVLSSISIGLGDTISISSLTYEAPL